MRSVSRPILLALAGAGLTAVCVVPASARQCASGQILQVSKGRCISKATAAKAGIVVRHKVAALSTSKAASPADDAGDRARGDKSRADRARGDRAATAQPAEPPVRTVAVRSDPAKAREAWNAAVAAAEKGGEATAPTLNFAQAEGDVRRNIAPFGALQFGGLR